MTDVPQVTLNAGNDVKINPIKTCPKCSKALPRTKEFFWERSGTPYFYSWCKNCVRAHTREVQRKRRMSPTDRATVLEEKYRYKNSEKGILNKRERSAIDNNKRRQRKKAIAYNWTLEMWEKCKQAWKNKCAYCGATAKLTQDHFIPLSHPQCTGTIQGNMVPACLKCNCSKGSIHPQDWIVDKQAYVRIIEVLDYLKKFPT